MYLSMKIQNDTVHYLNVTNSILSMSRLTKFLVNKNKLDTDFRIIVYNYRIPENRNKKFELYYFDKFNKLCIENSSNSAKQLINSLFIDYGNYWDSHPIKGGMIIVIYEKIN